MRRSSRAPALFMRLVGHAGAHGAVADHAHDVVVALGEIARHRHAEAGGDRGRGMRGAERVVLALGAAREAGEPARRAQRADAVAPSGDDLVRIGLVADVPDQAVARGVEDPMQRDRELDDAEAGAEVAAGHRDGVDRLLPQLVGELRKFGFFELAQILGRLHAVEKRRLRSAIHRAIPSCDYNVLLCHTVAPPQGSNRRGRLRKRKSAAPGGAAPW